MNITVTDQENCKKQLQIEIPGEDVRAETDKVASQLARSVHVPGFRPGHAPAPRPCAKRAGPLLTLSC